jgi:small ligand-binding sensory domain FIST
MQHSYAVAARWQGGFDDDGLQRWAADLRARLTMDAVTLGLIYMTPGLFPHASEVLEVLRVHAQIPLLAGCSSTGLICNGEEAEDTDGLVLALFHLPGAEVQAFRFEQSQLEAVEGDGFWNGETGLGPDQTNGWLVFADPFHLDPETWLRQWSADWPAAPILGGLASGDFQQRTTQVYLNGDVFEEGGVAVSIGGEVALESVIAQGCTPIGQPWAITKVEQHIIHEIANRPAYHVLVDTFNALPAAEQKRMQGNLFVGLVTNEYREEFHRGDFLIRNLMAADPEAGCILVGAFPRVGQTIQFQKRDRQAASDDLKAMLEDAKQRLTGRTIYGGSLHCCNGRGQRLFGKPSHDASSAQEQLGPLALAGFFCNGEIGPVGGKNFLHGYTASLALFVKK